MGDKFPNGEAKGRELVRARLERSHKQLIDLQNPLEERLLELLQQTTGRLCIYKEELPKTQSEQARLVRSRLKWLNEKFSSSS